MCVCDCKRICIWDMHMHIHISYIQYYMCVCACVHCSIKSPKCLGHPTFVHTAHSCLKPRDKNLSTQTPHTHQTHLQAIRIFQQGMQTLPTSDCCPGSLFPWQHPADLEETFHDSFLQQRDNILSLLHWQDLCFDLHVSNRCAWPRRDEKTNIHELW